MVYLWLGLAIASTVGYHVVMKITPAASNPFLSLAVTYAIGSAVFLGAYAVSPGTTPPTTSTPVRLLPGSISPKTDWLGSGRSAAAFAVLPSASIKYFAGQ